MPRWAASVIVASLAIGAAPVSWFCYWAAWALLGVAYALMLVVIICKQI